VPLLAINALDDPVCVAGNIEPELFEVNPHLILATTKYGSHLAFYEGATAVPWVDTAVVQFFDSVLKLPRPSTDVNDTTASSSS
jgi:predicted alpha/beta-fold hydrolase